MNNLQNNKKSNTPKMGHDTLLYAVFDGGGQGMRDVGLMGVFDSKEKANKAVGEQWLIIKEIKINVLCENGL